MHPRNEDHQSTLTAHGQTPHITVLGSQPQPRDSRSRLLHALRVLWATRCTFAKGQAITSVAMVTNKSRGRICSLNEQYCNMTDRSRALPRLTALPNPDVVLSRPIERGKFRVTHPNVANVLQEVGQETIVRHPVEVDIPVSIAGC